MVKIGIGQDSHRFDKFNKKKKLILGGVVIDQAYPFISNSDGDVVFHAITNAISGITGINILGAVADRMCKQGIVDSKQYLIEAIKYLSGMDYKITHISISVECKIPMLSPYIEMIKKKIVEIAGISYRDVGITVTSGEGLTPFGKGEGVQAIAVVTAIKNNNEI